MSIDEALSNNWLEIWYQPQIDLRRKCLAGAEALLRMHHPQAGLLWPEDYTGALDDESLVKLTEYSLVTAMRQWVVLRRRASGCSFPSMCRANLLPNIPINALVTAHRPQSEKWPGLILELTEDQIVRDFSAIRQGIEIERHRHSDR